MKSVALQALVGILAATGTVDARALKPRACKARTLTTTVTGGATEAATSIVSSTWSSTAVPAISTTAASSSSVVVTTSASSAAATTSKVSSSSAAATTSKASPTSSSASSTTASSTSSASSSLSTSLPLDTLFKDHNRIFVGVPTDKNKMSADSRISSTLLSEFGSVTPENSMKWDATEPSRNSFTFTAGDALVSYAQTNNLSVRGHTLVWHEQLPTWVSDITDAATMKEVLTNHVTKVVSHYKGKVRSWDVVNEVFNDDGSMRETVFYKLLGEDYISLVFNAARAADPDAKLYINEYSLDLTTRKKLTNGMIPKVKEWLAAGIPIDGIGSESHLDGGNVSEVPECIKMLADTGISEISLTELDISNAAAEDYTTVFQGCLDVPQCVGITVWGVSDAVAWRPGAVLFDDNYAAKPALAAVKKLLASA